MRLRARLFSGPYSARRLIRQNRVRPAAQWSETDSRRKNARDRFCEVPVTERIGTERNHNPEAARTAERTASELGQGLPRSLAINPPFRDMTVRPSTRISN